MKKILKSVIVLSPIAVIFLYGKAFAQAVGVETGGVSQCSQDPGTSFTGCMRYLLGWAVGIAGIIFVVMFLVGGIQYLTSAGNEEAAGKAKKLLIDAVIGMIVTAVAYIAARWVLQGLGVTPQV